MAVALAALLEGATAAALDASPYFVRDSERQREWMLRWAINTCQDELCDTARAHHWELMWQSLMHRAMRTWTSHALLGAAAESLSAAGEAFLHTIHLARTRRAWRRWPHRRSRLASARQLFLAWALLCERGEQATAIAMLAVAGAAVGRNRVLAALTRRWWAAASLQASLRAVGAAAALRADERCMLIAMRCLHFAAEARRNALNEEVFRCACADAHLRGWRRASALGLWRELAVTAALMAARSLAVEEERKRSSLSRWSESYHAAAAAALTSTLHVVPELLPATNDQRPLHRVGSLEMNTMLRSEEEAAAAEAAMMAAPATLIAS